MSRRSEINPALKHSTDYVRLNSLVRGNVYYNLWKRANMLGMSMADVMEAMLQIVEGNPELESQLTLNMRRIKLGKTKAKMRRRAAAKVALKLGDIALDRLDEAYQQTIEDIVPMDGGELADVKHAIV